jgi:putative cell wall-binding protein
MKKIVLISSLLFSTVMAEELVEPPQNPTSAVSKVMERFSSLSTIESTPIEDVLEEKAVEATSVVEGENIEKLEPIQTAKFESKEMPYPEEKEAVKELVKKGEEIQPKTKIIEKEELKEVKKIKNKSLTELEENARKVIEEEIKKVEEAKRSALERINKVVEHVEEAKENQKSF